MGEETDAQLVARTLGGDMAAFEAIVDRHRAPLVALAAGLLGSAEDAEDAAQEAFVHAFFRLNQLRKPESLLPWLRRVTERLALARLRRRREEPVEPVSLERMRARDPGPDGAADAHTSELLRRLPQAMRTTFALTYLAGYTCAETASLLGIREGTVKSRLSRARALLKEAFPMAKEDLTKRKPGDEFTRRTIDRLMREARGLMAKGELDAAAQRANRVLDIQAKALFESGDDPRIKFDQEAARISGLALKERRRRDCEANAAQYGFRLEDLDWELGDVEVLSGTLGRPAGRGSDAWGIPLSRMRLRIMDARDICRRLRCSPQMLAAWVEQGCPVLRCWPFARFDLDRVKQWVRDSGIRRLADWPEEDDHDLDRPVRLIFKALHRREVTPEQAEKIMTDLGFDVWG
jgi:RNA polymerase sigma-70 factor (ECF subfamily)